MNQTVPYESERRAMVETQLRRRGIQDPRVLEAMLSVPRHEFVAPGLARRAYEDRPLPIGQSETISQPYIVAVMTEASRVQPGDQVLEVGAGSGYQAAIMSWLGARVFAVERNPGLAEAARHRLSRLDIEGVQIITGDGTEGYPVAAPYQVILVTAASPPTIPQPLLDQLANGGRLVIPVGEFHHQELKVVFKHADEFATRDLDPCQFVPLVGKYGWPEIKTLRGS